MIKEVLDVMVDLAKGGMTMIVVTHEMGFAKEVADSMIFMDEGSIVEKAKTNGIFENPKSEYTRELIAAYYNQLGIGRFLLFKNSLL